MRETTGDLERQTLNRGGTLETSPHTAREQAEELGALGQAVYGASV